MATLYSTAEDLMSLTLAALTELGRPIPARQVIYMGEIPADCEQVAVVFGAYNPQPPPEGLVPCGTYRWAGDYSVLITRACVPMPSRKGSPPSASAMSTAAGESSADAEVMLKVVAGLGEHGAVSILTAAPSGGLQTVNLDVTVPVI